MSTVLGAVLIFGILVVAYSTYQGVVVPQQNEQAEIDHNERVQHQLLELRDTVLQTGATGTVQTQTLTLGATYPRRTVTANFATTGGVIGTIKPHPNGQNNITLNNLTALNAETADYLNTSRRQLGYPQREIAHVPIYTYYQNAPSTTLSTGTVFNRFEDANLSIGDQVLINGNRITVVVLNGSLRKSKSGQGATVSVETTPLSVAQGRSLSRTRMEKTSRCKSRQR